MRLFTEIKIAGDAYPGGFSTGLTMHGSATMERVALKSGNEDLSEGIAEYGSSDGISLTVTKTRDGSALRVKTTVTNNTSKKISLEYLTSFALSGVQSDKIFRLQSFWSAEGRLRTETVGSQFQRGSRIGIQRQQEAIRHQAFACYMCP